MKIKLIHSAQVAGSKGKVEQHPPGTVLNIDNEQGKRLVDNGYAVLNSGAEVEDPVKTEGDGPDQNPPA